MSRTISAAERAAISSLRSAVYGRIEITDSLGAYVDYSTGLLGVDYFDALTLSDNIDDNVMSLDGSLKRCVGTASLAPFMAASRLNLTTGSYATKLDLYRLWKVSTAVKAAGYAPTSTDWKYIGQGRVDVIDVGDDQIHITGRSDECVLLDTWIQTEKQYGSVGGIAMETVIQSMLDDNLGTSAVTLYTPVSPGFLMNVWTQQKGSLMVAIQDVAAKAGFKVRYRYDASDVWRLTLYKPDRTASVELWTIGPSEYTAVPMNKIDISGVRSFIKERFVDPTLGTQTVIYPHMAGTGTLTCAAGVGTFSSSQAGIVRLDSRTNVIVAGIAYTISAFNGTTGCTVSSQLASGGVPTFGASAFTLHDTLSGAGLTTSLTRFGRRDLEIDLSYTSQVNNATNAQAMVDAVGSDTEFPNLEQQFEGSGWWFIQLHDYGKFLANGIHYDSDQRGGVTSTSVNLANASAKWTIGARGKPSGAYISWRMLTQKASSPTTATIPLTLRAKALTTTATQIVFRVAVADALPLTDISLTYAGTGVGTIAPSSPLTILKANVTSDIETTGTKDITVDRAAFGSGTGRITFTATASNRVTSTDSGEVPSLDRDTVELLCRAKVQSTSATQVVFRVAVADPVTGGSGNVTVTYTGTGVGTIAPASPQALLSAGITTDIDTTATVDITVDRAAFGSGTGRITFTATRAGRAASTDSGDVPALDRDTQSITVRVTRISETASQIVVRVEGITPNAAATATVNYDGGGLTVSPATGGTFAATTSFGTTGHIDYTITRDTQGGTPRRVAFTVTAPGSIDGTDGVDTSPNSTRNRCNLVMTGTGSQATGTTPTVITTWSESATGGSDVGNLHDDSTNPGRITIPTGGGGRPWIFTVSIGFQFNATGDRYIEIRKNGTAVRVVCLPSTKTASNTTVIPVYLFDPSPTATDYYEAAIWQNSGITLNISAGSTESCFSACDLW